MSSRDYAGGAVATTLSSGIGSNATSLSIGAADGWPDGTGGKFYVTLDRTGSSPEKILVQSRSGTTLTLASTDDRGVDGTTAASHLAGVTVEHTIASPDVSEPNAHINDTTLDHHTQYLNNARHDSPARHTVGTVIATAAPSTITPDNANGAGIASTVAASDHTHQIVTDTPGDSAVGDTASKGVATSFARSDHTHGREDFAVPGDAAVGDTADEGVATTVARSDHQHGMPAWATTTEIADIAATETAGTSDTIARGDHVHKGMGTDAWTDYSATISLTNITMGSGGVTVARYRQVGKTVNVNITLVLGTGGALTGSAAVSLPVATVNRASQEWNGPVNYVDTGTAHYRGGCTVPGNSSTAILLSGVSATNQGLTNATSPFTFGNTDRIVIDLTYESA